MGRASATGGSSLSFIVLFGGSVGRTDFPYGDGAALLRSIREKLFPLGDEVTFLCGHGPGSTIVLERPTNRMRATPDESWHYVSAVPL